MDRALVAALAARLDRRVAFSVSITDRELYLSIGTDTLTGGVTRLTTQPLTAKTRTHEEARVEEVSLTGSRFGLYLRLRR